MAMNTGVIAERTPLARPPVEQFRCRKDRKALQIGDVLCHLGHRAQPIDACGKRLVIATVARRENQYSRGFVSGP